MAQRHMKTERMTQRYRKNKTQQVPSYIFGWIRTGIWRKSRMDEASWSAKKQGVSRLSRFGSMIKAYRRQEDG